MKFNKNMRITVSNPKFKPRILPFAVFILFIFTLHLSGCSITLPFDTIVIQGNSSDYKEKTPKLEIIVNAPTDLVLDIATGDQKIVQSVDFSKYFVIIIFHGFAGSAWLEIQDIWQKTNGVYLKAKFFESTQSIFSSTYQIVKIDKSSLKQSGDITFKLLDESGHEIANITQSIPEITHKE